MLHLLQYVFAIGSMASREAKERFVTGLAGTTRAEVAATVLIVPIMTLAIAGLSRSAHQLLPDRGKPTRLKSFAALLGELCALVLPETAVMMSCAAPGPTLAAACLVAAACLSVSSQLSMPSAQRRQELNALIADFSGRLKG